LAIYVAFNLTKTAFMQQMKTMATESIKNWVAVYS